VSQLDLIGGWDGEKGKFLLEGGLPPAIFGKGISVDKRER